MSIRSRDLSAFYELIYNPGYAPSRSADAHIEALEVEGNRTYVLMKESTGDYYEVDGTTNAIWSALDGKKTIKEIWNTVTKAESPITEKSVRDVVVSLAEEGAIETTEAEIEEKRVQLASAFQLDIRLLKDCSKSLAGAFKVTRKLIRRVDLYIALAISAVGVVLFSQTFIHLFSDPSTFEIGGSTLVGILFYSLIVLSPAYAVHELTHAAVCDYYGGRPRALGTGLFYLAPFFFVDTSDSWRLPRRARIMISVTGPLVDLVIGSFLTFWSYFVAPGFGKSVLQISAFLCFYGVLLNLSPVIETDGFYIASELVNNPNVRDDALAYLKRQIVGRVRKVSSRGRYSAKQRRIFIGFGVAAVAWFALFAYTTGEFLYVYSADAYRAVTVLSEIALRSRPPDLGTITINVVALAYFALFLTGFGVMGIVAYRKARVKGVKLETIHDKRASVVLPLPSVLKRESAQKLVDSARGVTRKWSRSGTVTLEPPLCVASLRLGRVDQSLDETRGDMQRVEHDFRELHHVFLSSNLPELRSSPKMKMPRDQLYSLASHFPAFERKGASKSVEQFLERQDGRVQLLFEASVGTIWTMELSPDDYKRIRRELFPSIIAEDLGVTDFSGELEAFKKQVVLGTDAIAQLSSEVDEESKELKRSPELYQLTALLEPVKSRLVFIGRTDKVEGSIVWLGGLFLYQAWTSYIRQTLDEATIGLKAIRLAPSITITKFQASKLPGRELEPLRQDLLRMKEVLQVAEESISKIESTYDSANNFHEALTSLVSDESFDIGLYRPILSSNSRHLEGVRNEIDAFRTELARIRRAFDESFDNVQSEHSTRASFAVPRRGALRSLGGSVGSIFRVDRGSQTPVFERQVKLTFAASRLLYTVVVGSDLIV